MPMNRAQRRKAERNERKGIAYTERVVALPAVLDEFVVFKIPQSILDQISNKHIDSAQGVPVFKDDDGLWTEVVPAMEGWIVTWEMINEKLGLNINLMPLKVINKRLNTNTPITMKNSVDALACLNECRKAFRSSNRKEIVKIAKTAQLKILLETKHDQVA